MRKIILISLLLISCSKSQETHDAIQQLDSSSQDLSADATATTAAADATATTTDATATAE